MIGSPRVESTLTLPCVPMPADPVLVILSGPPDAISREGFETGCYLFEGETDNVEVLAGDEPIPSGQRSRQPWCSQM